MIRTGSKSNPFEQEARKLVDEQLIASGQRKNTLLRRRSKLTSNETGAIALTLNQYVASNPSLPEGMLAAFLQLLESTTTSPEELSRQMNDLLISNAQCGSPHIIATLAAKAQPDVLASVLSNAIYTKNTALISGLLDVGADPNRLNDLELIQFVKIEARMFKRMQRTHPIPDSKLQTLCVQAIQHGDVDALTALINGRMDVKGPSKKPHFSPSDRDALLLLVVKSSYQNILPILETFAARTNLWPIQDPSIIRVALDNTQNEYALQKSIFYCIFKRFQMPESFSNGLDIEYVFFRCLENGRYDLLSIMASSNLRVPVNIIAFACEEELSEALDELLKGDIQIPYKIWSHTPSLMRSGTATLIIKLLDYMFKHYIDVPDKNQLFTQCLASGQLILIDRLMDAGVQLDYNAGEPLRIAIHSENLNMVRRILKGQLSVNSIEYGLLTASLVNQKSQPPILDLLLETGLPKISIVNHLLLLVLCDSYVSYNSVTMEKLLLYILDHSRSHDISVRDMNIMSINACLGAKQELQKLINDHEPMMASTAQRLDFEMCQILLPSEDITTDENEFCQTLPNIDTLLEHFSLDPENMPLKLLEKHIRECAEYIGASAQWPMGITSFLVGRMSVNVRSNQSLYDCMSLAFDFGQLKVFEKLLANCEFSSEGYRIFEATQVFSNKELLYHILDHLNKLNITAEEYLGVVTPWFVYACQKGQLPLAISVCKKFRYKAPLSPAIEYVKMAIKEDINLPNVRRLLHQVTSSQSDLETLWVQTFEYPTVCHLDRIRLIMEAGYRGVRIDRVIMREIALSSDSTLLSTILNNWHISNPTGCTISFDYGNRTMKTPAKTYVSKLDDRYHDVLASAMSLSIMYQRPELCVILIEKGAPLVYNEIPLIQTAVECGGDASLEEDTILSMLFQAAGMNSDPQAILDFTLWQAVRCDRIQLMLDLAKRGASPLAYDAECWCTALHKSGDKVLKSLLSVHIVRDDLAAYFASFLSSLATQVKDLDDQCALLLKLHEAGFTNRASFDWAFSVLCDSGLLTPDRAQVLFQCGATADHRRMLRYNLVNGDAATFHSLVATCDDHEVIQEIFLEACHRLETRQGNFFKSTDPATALSVLEILFQFRIKQQHLDSAFQSLVRRTVNDRNLLPVLHALLRSGALFDASNASGEVFAKCYMLDDLQLISLVSQANPPVETRSKALKYMLSEASLGRVRIPDLSRSVEKEKKAGYRIGIPHATLLELLGYIFNEGVASAEMVRGLFSWTKIDSDPSDCDSNCSEQIEALLSFAINTLEGFEDKIFRMEQISAVLEWLRNVRQGLAKADICSLGDDAFERLFLQASSKGLVIILRSMIKLNIDVDTRDESGHSALFLATRDKHMDVVDMLIDAGASPDDGSLHIAISQQDHAAIAGLLAAGHSAQHASDLFSGATPLGLLIDEATVDEAFKTTLLDLLNFIYNSSGAAVVTRAITSSLRQALLSDEAYELIAALMTFFELHEDVVEALRDSEIVIGRLTYSALSLIEHWEDARLEDDQRELLAAQLQSFDIKPCLFATEGDQPPNATGIPEHLQRKHAFKTQECSICGDFAQSPDLIYARLTPDCEGIHSWEDGIICHECLREYIAAKMWPHDDEKIKYKFPAAKIFCWAPNCTKTEIDHHILRDLVDEGVFMMYDDALFQQECNSGSSMVKCATPNCAGAIWVDDEEREQIKIFVCPVCFDNTCMECNDLYEKHDNQPCPAGAQAREDERKKAEEELSEEAMRREKRCPNCRLVYEKYYGCDHIICGKNVYDNRVDKGCRYEFCNVCLGAWPNGHTATCGLRG